MDPIKLSGHEKNEIDKCFTLAAALERLLADRAIARINLDNEIADLARRLSDARTDRDKRIEMVARMHGLDGQSFAYDRITGEVKVAKSPDVKVP